MLAEVEKWGYLERLDLVNRIANVVAEGLIEDDDDGQEADERDVAAADYLQTAMDAVDDARNRMQNAGWEYVKRAPD